MVNPSKIIETAAGGCLGTLVTKLASLTLSEISQLSDISGNIDWLKEELQILHAVLLDLSNEENPSHQMKLWKNKIRELSYDIDDAISGFLLASSKEQDPGLQHDPGFVDRIMATIRSCTDRIRSLPSDFGITREIKKLKDRVSAAEDRHKRLKTGTNSDAGPSYDAIPIRDVAQYADPASLVGIDSPREEIVRKLSLQGTDSSVNPRMVVAIVGFGGLGKTTLAKQVFDKIAGNFRCTAFVPVSRNPDINKVLRDILLDFNCGDSAEALRQLDQRQLTNKLRKYIEGKRYLVAVDDIWSKDAWRILGSALFNNNNDSRIIVTTRKNDVAEECCSSSIDHVYKMDPLDKNDSENLFVEKAFGRKGCPPNLRDVCGKILKKCAGSPLAIITLSGLLSNKVTVSQCEEVLYSLSNAVPEDSDVDAMRKILSFSYFDLPHHLRTCLLYFSMFPEDMKIRRKRLVNMWIAEGFVHCSDGRSKTEIAGHYFDQLISRNLIQPVDIQYDGQAQACRVHDTILDFIVSKSLEENFVSFLGYYQLGRPDDKVRRLSIHYKEFRDGAGLSGQDLSHVRSLCIFGEPLHKTCTVSLRGLTNLRVLDAKDGSPYYTERSNGFDVSRFPHIDFDVSVSPHLKYLDMYELMPMVMSREFYTREVLTGIANLQYLETLDLSTADVTELPSDIYKLQHLVRLFILPDVKLAAGIGRMEALEELKKISIYSFYSLEFLQELAQLTKLRSIHIRIEDGQIGLEQELVLISSIYKLSMCNLHSLKIDVFDKRGVEYGTYPLAMSEAHSSQHPLQSLRKFKMRHGHLTKIPDWMGSLNHLEKLVLEVREMEQKDLDILGELPSLLYLFFAVIECPKEMLTFRESTGFHCLKYLEVGNFRNGAVMLEFQAGSMPRLEYLELRIHTSDSTLCGCYVSGIEHLNMLTTVRVRILEELNQDGVATDVESAITSAVDKLPNNPTLSIEVCSVVLQHDKAYNMRVGRRRSRRFSISKRRHI
ncbi:disease resistance protein RGA5-like isoform X1 [Panicum virgatum]|uniref:Uncharacterized protein n=1 Tax=Panicum virgatum TaxID=38727 RepID=A0A8T0XLX1_PANVG|nr:disease resistance protein RGA5-like isoform X1 [Panicum virgatum]XP_039850946.1 disease resistance protein RGA5-like isoform X1 [Panicum virgatum]KAG2659973.1 hypothetical protein PVAP13_1KG387905 [Panicum virgatum]KAG2659974.1 hypothetical protein PVAP13_1KG387905 [Panicum virgatum]KAG2659975.1 hypothetical protein PVAP13_1KG387905 [Panicum virgatum]KAG2659976.1 hypothetical protein PVAP13_1KG387905 [Panicum virgatum]KAG2659977.1 hypothetical protein PVAP13_1KG387905 [Panicum virgatum]